MLRAKITDAVCRKKTVLDDLCARELSCSNAVTECLQKRDRARVGLQSAMREQEHLCRHLRV